MGSCQSTHYDLYIVTISGTDVAVLRSRAEAEHYTSLHAQKIHVTIRHLVVDRQTGIVMNQLHL
jgi:hypothetical protein